MSRQIAYILLNSVRAFDPDAAIKALRERHPNVPIEPMTGSVDQTAGSLVVRCAGDPILVLTVPTPLPAQQWDFPSRRASTTWPQAPSVFAGHRAHLVIRTLVEPNDRLHSARSIAAVAGALITTLPGCVAVLWENLVAGSAESWEAASRDAFVPYPRFPYRLWLSLHPFQDGGKTGVISFGLSSFLGCEIEFEPQAVSPADAVERVAGLAVYLMQNGPVLEDGDTFGATAAERIRVRYTQSSRAPGLAVLHATPEAA